jgi:hypothetical protein
MDPAQSIASITAVLDALKKARDVAKRLKDAEVQEVLLEAQERALSLKEELLSLRAENIGLKEQLATQVAVLFDGGAYWSTDDRDGPYCSRCYDVDKRLVRLKPSHELWHQCPACDKPFEVTSAPRKMAPPISRGSSFPRFPRDSRDY